MSAKDTTITMFQLESMLQTAFLDAIYGRIRTFEARLVARDLTGTNEEDRKQLVDKIDRLKALATVVPTIKMDNGQFCISAEKDGASFSVSTQWTRMRL